MHGKDTSNDSCVERHEQCGNGKGQLSQGGAADLARNCASSFLLELLTEPWMRNLSDRLPVANHRLRQIIRRLLAGGTSVAASSALVDYPRPADPVGPGDPAALVALELAVAAQTLAGTG